jgi:hypothetical protein
MRSVILLTPFSGNVTCVPKPPVETENQRKEDRIVKTDYLLQQMYQYGSTSYGLTS